MMPLPMPGLWGSPVLSAPMPAALAAQPGQAQATARGALGKTGWLLLLTAIVMALVWLQFHPAAVANDTAVLKPLGNAALACGVVAMSLVFVGRYKVTWLPVIAPIYAIFAAFFLGGLSVGAEAEFPGIALNTILATAAVFVVMAVGYALRWFRPTARFRAAVFSITAAIALVYLVALGMALIGLRMPFIHDAGWGGILWTGFICTVAAMHLLIDFQRIEALDRQARSLYMEWYAALGLLVTLVWLYLFMLRLLQHIKR